mmetsp:Transcript_137012/g.341579  ORF Transcript_137012/g.341579 Transcript_137012/m.341579 type:complete len:279 (-) Transcript_137012:165-1001(-)
MLGVVHLAVLPDRVSKLSSFYAPVVVQVQAVEHTFCLFLGERGLKTLSGQGELFRQGDIVVVPVQQPEVVVWPALPRERHPGLLLEDFPEPGEGQRALRVAVWRILRPILVRQVVVHLRRRQVGRHRRRSGCRRRRRRRRGTRGGRCGSRCRRSRGLRRGSGRRRGGRSLCRRRPAAGRRGSGGAARGRVEMPGVHLTEKLLAGDLAAGVGVEGAEGEGGLSIREGWLEGLDPAHELIEAERLLVQRGVEVVRRGVHLRKGGLDRGVHGQQASLELLH